MNIEVDPTSSNLASAMLNSKIRPRAVVGYGVKIFHASPPNYVTRSPGSGCQATLPYQRCVTSLKTAAKETKLGGKSDKIQLHVFSEPVRGV